MSSRALSPLLIDPRGRLLVRNATDRQIYQVVGACCDGPNQPYDLLGCPLPEAKVREAQSRRADLIMWLLLAVLGLAAVACRPARLPREAERAAPSKSFSTK
jgi:hypothetical protein